MSSAAAAGRLDVAVHGVVAVTVTVVMVVIRAAQSGPGDSGTYGQARTLPVK